MYRTYQPSKRSKKPNHTKAYLLLAVALLLASGYFWIHSKSSANGRDAKQQKETKQVVKKPEPVKPQKDAELERLITSWAQTHPGSYGISVREINGTQRYASYQPDTKFIAASTYKLFLTYAVMNDIEQGKHTLNSVISTGQTVNQCLDLMLLKSDNACTKPLGQLVGWPAIDTFIQANGFANTQIDNYGPRSSRDKLTTAADLSEFMWRLHHKQLMNAEHTQAILDRMKKQVWRERVPAGVPTGIEVADKPGWLGPIENDAAIVYGTKSTYVITIVSSGSSAANLAALSKSVYDYLNS